MSPTFFNNFGQGFIAPALQEQKKQEERRSRQPIFKPLVLTPQVEYRKPSTGSGVFSVITILTLLLFGVTAYLKIMKQDSPK